MDERKLSRRASLASLGGLVAGAAGLAGLREAEEAGAGPAGVASGLITCVLAPEQTEGPYYVDDAALRGDVREGRPGVLLTLRLTVVNASSCKPIKGAAVEIWHCDAGGVYSATGVQDTEDERFLRGVQRTDARGSRSSRRSTPAGTRAAPCTSTRWSTSAAISCTRDSSTSPMP
jgi:Dioxygenase